jgi:hypothetical protein
MENKAPERIWAARGSSQMFADEPISDADEYVRADLCGRPHPDLLREFWEYEGKFFTSRVAAEEYARRGGVPYPMIGYGVANGELDFTQ